MKQCCIRVLIVLSLILFLFPLSPASAEAVTLDIHVDNSPLTDGDFTTYSTVDSPLTLSAQSDIHTLYILFRDKPVDLTIHSGDRSLSVGGTFLQQVYDLSAITGNHLTLIFAEPVAIADIYAFSDGELPEFVHRWNPPHDRADFLLISTHADDEQLYFAGLLPYYAGERGYRVQVAYFTDHSNDLHRRHELLNGLWTVGVHHYPVFSSFPDRKCADYQAALKRFEKDGFREQDAINFHVGLLRRFQPQVVVGHDLAGEYGHGQHCLNSNTLVRAIDVAADETFVDADAYAVWNTPKLYLHLYAENPIVMNWDIPLARFEGKTAFQMSQQGFLCHTSQLSSHYYAWLNGEDGTNALAANIQEHSPCRYGLYRSTVGPDEDKNDLFEHLISYDEQERLEEEIRRTTTVTAETTTASSNTVTMPISASASPTTNFIPPTISQGTVSVAKRTESLPLMVGIGVLATATVLFVFSVHRKK